MGVQAQRPTTLQTRTVHPCCCCWWRSLVWVSWVCSACQLWVCVCESGGRASARLWAARVCACWRNLPRCGRLHQLRAAPSRFCVRDEVRFGDACLRWWQCARVRSSACVGQESSLARHAVGCRARGALRGSEEVMGPRGERLGFLRCTCVAWTAGAPPELTCTWTPLSSSLVGRSGGAQVCV